MIATPAWLREPCEPPQLPASDAPSIGEVLSFALDQERALQDCDQRRAQALKLIQDANMVAAGKDPAAKKAPKWWMRLGR